MSEDEIIQMAVECGIIPWTKHEYIGDQKFTATDEGLDGDLASLIQFFQMATAHEREAIAQMIENAPALVDFVKNDRGGCMICGFTPSVAAAAIRSRGEQ